MPHAATVRMDRSFMLFALDRAGPRGPVDIAQVDEGGDVISRVVCEQNIRSRGAVA